MGQILSTASYVFVAQLKPSGSVYGFRRCVQQGPATNVAGALGVLYLSIRSFCHLQVGFRFQLAGNFKRGGLGGYW